MRTPFPYFGSKRLVAPDIWRRFGDPTYYFEPFGGALGALLERPNPGKAEYVGDTDCLISNFFRAAKYGSPKQLAEFSDWPTSQLDLVARSSWLRQQHARLHAALTADPKWHDPEVAAWYAWVNSVRISSNGTTITLGRASGVRRRSQGLVEYFESLSDRLKNVVIDYGDWTRMANASERQSNQADCAILLDPPYDLSTGRRKSLYAQDSPNVSSYVCRWALARSISHPRLRIAICGYEGEHQLPQSWEEMPWWSQFGRGRERIWFSPNCLKTAQRRHEEASLSRKAAG